ncbi:MAG: hypothetical protein AAFZ87_03110 [Planctomycetota bacterium]
MARITEALLAGAAALALAGCGAENGSEEGGATEGAAAEGAEDPLAATPWPEGTVLVAEGQALTAEEVDAYVELISMVEPEFVETDHKRKAIANISIPILAARAILPEERLEAFALAQSYLSTARETGQFPPGVEPKFMSGTWADVGMVEWEAARKTLQGDFSGLVETPGGWTFLRVVEHEVAPGQPFEATTPVKVEVVTVPFIDTPDLRDLLESAIEQIQFEVIDPAWEPIVPPYYLHRKKPYEERYR